MLPNDWRGSRPVQQKLLNMEYSSVMQVPNSKDGALLTALCKIEHRLAKTSGYHCKLVEKGGRPLSLSFSKNLNAGNCGRSECQICINPKNKGPSMCKVSSVVYECVCVLCDEIHRSDPTQTHRGVYIGETYRTLFERAIEHKRALDNFDPKGFMSKHWAICHNDLDTPPAFRFRVLEKSQSPLNRKITEAVLISKLGVTMNSKAEWGV